MELRHLRYFVAVGDEKHYGRAAKQLHLAQPAHQIQDLEEEIGFRLFDRLPRGVKICAAGKSFLEDSGQSGTLRVGFVEGISWHGVVPDSFSLLRRKCVFGPNC